MKHHDISEQLSSLKVPEQDPKKRDKALHRALIALKQPEAPTAQDEPQAGTFVWLPLLKWTALAAVLLLLPIVYLGQNRTADPAVVDKEIMLEMERLFAGQLQAIVRKDGQIDIQLGPDEAMTRGAGDQRIRLRVESGGSKLEVLTYSGSSVCVQMEGRARCFEILMQANGGVLVISEGMVWSSETTLVVQGLRIDAMALESAGGGA
ncbi:MAG: hypothetical protein ACFCUX_02295 [Candidatus Methylacidiphilales bacterium]